MALGAASELVASVAVRAVDIPVVVQNDGTGRSVLVNLSLREPDMLR